MDSTAESGIDQGDGGAEGLHWILRGMDACQVVEGFSHDLLWQLRATVLDGPRMRLGPFVKDEGGTVWRVERDQTFVTDHREVNLSSYNVKTAWSFYSGMSFKVWSHEEEEGERRTHQGLRLWPPQPLKGEEVDDQLSESIERAKVKIRRLQMKRALREMGVLGGGRFHLVEEEREEEEEEDDVEELSRTLQEMIQKRRPL